MEPTLGSLQRQVRRLQIYASVLTIALVAAVLVAFRSQSNQVLRVRGIVIEDSAGRERILIGAPIPSAKARVRTDSVRVRTTWGPRFPAAYLEWYKSYRHDMTGVLVLDTAGFDRLALGDPVPDPNIGRRIAPSAGLVINDGQGFERSGYGLLRVDGKDRVVLGLDNASGEALALFVDDAGRVGISAQDGGRSFWLGGTQPAMPSLGIGAGFFGLPLRDKQGLTRRFSVGGGPPPR